MKKTVKYTSLDEALEKISNKYLEIMEIPSGEELIDEYSSSPEFDNKMLEMIRNMCANTNDELLKAETGDKNG